MEIVIRHPLGPSQDETAPFTQAPGGPSGGGLKQLDHDGPSDKNDEDSPVIVSGGGWAARLIDKTAAPPSKVE